MKSEEVQFAGHDGRTLVGRLDRPDDENISALALYAHCFTCSKNFKAAANIAKTLVEHQVGVLRFDFAGLGESEGDFADTNFSTNVEDLIGAASFAASVARSPDILIGHSLGGAAVLQAAAAIESSRLVITIGAPHDPGHVTHLFDAHEEEVEEKGFAVVTIAGREFTIKKQFFDDVRDKDVDAAIGNLDKPLLIFHSPLDDIVGIDNAALIFKAAKHPKSFISLDKADHLLNRREDADFVGSLIATWSRRYLE